MSEIGIDISGQKSKTLEEYLGQPFDYVITVCDAANEACPAFPGAKRRLHWSFEDPAAAVGSEEERLGVFRSVRDNIGEHIKGSFCWRLEAMTRGGGDEEERCRCDCGGCACGGECCGTPCRECDCPCCE